MFIEKFLKLLKIDLDTHRKLLDDIGNRFFIKKIQTRRVET